MRFLLLLLLCLGAAQAETLISPAQLRDDLREMRRVIAEIHPEPSFSADTAALDAAYRSLDAELAGLTQGLSRDQAWLRLARLNPLFNDAHWVVAQPDWRGQLQSHLQAGGGLFPFELQVGPEAQVHLRERLGGGASPWHGARLLAVNGRPVESLVPQLLALMHGDTPALRAELLSLRWSYYLWKCLGAPAQWRLRLQQGSRVHELQLPASQAEPLTLQRSTRFEAAHRFQLLPNGQALLTLHSFWWPDKARYFDFLRDSFAKLREAGTRTLFIDIRANPGGDDDQWKRGLLDRIAGTPYRNGGRFLKKVMPGRVGPGEVVGSTLPGEIQGWEPGAQDGPLRFDGAVYVLVGRSTYSSAILFANVVQDFGFATLVGGPGIARTRQSGGIQTRVLPHSGLEITVPRFILARHAGDGGPALVTPDLRLVDDPLDAHALIERLREGVSGAKPVGPGAAAILAP